MAVGPGKYDDLVSYVLQRSEATAAMVIVIAGRKGSGFSLHIDNSRLLLNLPGMLRDVADQVEQDIMKGIE